MSELTMIDKGYLEWSGKSIAYLTTMLTHAHQDAQHTGHCHWCHMTRILEKHVIIGYTHAEDCKLIAIMN